MKISIVVAVYRNEGAISITHEKIKTVFSNQLSGYEWEVIFVDDGSDDGSLQEILKIKETDPHVKAITFTRNFGQMAAILAGLKEATGDAAVNVSADLQDPVDLLQQMVQKWKEGAEIVICHRTNRSDPWSSKFFSAIAYGAIRISIPQMPTGGFDFVLMDRKVLNEFNAIDIRNRFFQGDLLWAGYRTSFIPYVRQKRSIGVSQYNLAKKLKNFIDAFLDASYLPIRIITAIGVITSSLGLFYCVTVVYSWFRGTTPFLGWAPIMIAIFVVGGLIMMMLGVIGEYTWRIYDEVRKKPNYVIRDKFF